MARRKILPMTMAKIEPPPPPPTVKLTVDAAALAHNWRTLDRMSGNAVAGAAVKADCYGLGVDTCIPVLSEAGARNFYVAHWSEVAAVARHVDPNSISVLHGVLNEQEAAYARAIGARPVINTPEQAQLWSQTGGGPCDVMVDTGINRLGISPDDISDPAIGALDIATLMSHLSSADEEADCNRQQRDLFARLAAQTKAQHYSLCNSAGIALGSAYHFDITRPGIALYGGVPRQEMDGQIRQVAYIQAIVMQIRQLEAGESVGYNGRFTAMGDHRVATVSLGYTDGFLRSRGTDGYLMHNDKMLKILGTVSMDMIIVDVSDAPDVQTGSWLDVPFNLPDAAQHSGLSQYELLTSIGPRLRR